jgi:hypothetical protein
MASYRLHQFKTKALNIREDELHIFNAPAVNYTVEHEEFTREIAMQIDRPYHEDGTLVKNYDKAIELGAWVFANCSINEDDNSVDITINHYFPTDEMFEEWIAFATAEFNKLDTPPDILTASGNPNPSLGVFDLGTVDFNKPYRP